MPRAIVVEELEPLTPEGYDDLGRWNALGRRLRELDPKRYARVLAICRAYVSIYEDPDESEEAFQARVRQALGRGVS